MPPKEAVKERDLDQEKAMADKGRSVLNFIRKYAIAAPKGKLPNSITLTRWQALTEESIRSDYPTQSEWDLLYKALQGDEACLSLDENAHVEFLPLGGEPHSERNPRSPQSPNTQRDKK